MQIIPLKTHRIETQDNLEKVLDRYVDRIEEGSILAITSKIISVIEGRLVDKGSISKRELIRQEADKILITEENPYNLYLTIKDGILIPSAGIDESNADNTYILYPKDPFTVAETVWNYLRQRFGFKNIGVLITDSHTTIMRRGVTGIALAWCGFKPLYSYVGKPDLYDHPLRVTHINTVDALATMAVFNMGEGNEQTPMAIIQQAPHIVFSDNPPSHEERASVIINPKDDLYAPLLTKAEWE